MKERAGRSGSSRRAAQRPKDLPEFENPPVVEVVLSVQFADLRAYRSLHSGLLWGRFRKAGFREFAEHPPLESRFETFGPQDRPQPRLKIFTGDQMPRLRTWFIKDGGNELIQVQPDRFVHNWRKVGDDDSYPRYEVIRERFFEELTGLQTFLDDERIGPIQPNQCEVTYVNLISIKGDVWARPDAALRVLSEVSPDPQDGAARLPKLENSQYAARFILTNDENEPIGRLIATAEPAIATEGERVLRLELTARGAPFTPELTGVRQFFDFGRDAVVRGFAAITTDEMHKAWKRTR